LQHAIQFIFKESTLKYQKELNNIQALLSKKYNYIILVIIGIDQKLDPRIFNDAVIF